MFCSEETCGVAANHSIRKDLHDDFFRENLESEFILHEPIGSMYGIFTNIWLISMINVGKYPIHGCYGWRNLSNPWFRRKRVKLVIYKIHGVADWNPAPAGMVSIPIKYRVLKKFYTSQVVVWDFRTINSISETWKIWPWFSTNTYKKCTTLCLKISSS